MKPFDLEKAKEGHPLITRDGRVAQFISILNTNMILPVRVNVQGAGEMQFTKAGRFVKISTPHPFDLFLTD